MNRDRLTWGCLHLNEKELDSFSAFRPAGLSTTCILNLSGIWLFFITVTILQYRNTGSYPFLAKRQNKNYHSYHMFNAAKKADTKQ
mmetsp:Transcript_18415/g.29683  ORF Transcript_18415/g.29683 Transcript_18415/m.29683 type:complete len:86 (-) Transcript_18415:279-536(-)